MTLEPSTSWEDTYRTLTRECGIVALTDWTQVELTGSDRVGFLQNMCTNDIRCLSPGEFCEAYLADVKGKIQSHFLVFVEKDRIALLSVPGQAERIIAHLGRYVIREDVELSDTSKNRSWALVVGPSAVKCLSPLLEDKGELPTEDRTHTSCSLTGQSSLVARIPLLWPGGFLVRAEGADLFEEKLELPMIDTSSPVWSSLRIESQFPLFGIDFNDSNLPQEVNRDLQTISFTKGCYLGQETVARIDALGHVNKKLVGITIDSQYVPDTGAKLLRNGEEVGMTTSVCWSPTAARPAALAMVKRGANELGSELESSVGQAVVVAAMQSAE